MTSTLTFIEDKTTEIIDYLKNHNKNGMLDYLIWLLWSYEDWLINLGDIESDGAYIDFMNHYWEKVKKELEEIFQKSNNKTQDHKTNLTDKEISTNILLWDGWWLMKLSIKKAEYLLDYLSNNIKINDEKISNVMAMLRLYIDNDGTVSEKDIYDNDDYMSLKDNKEIQQILVKYDVNHRKLQEDQKDREIQQLQEECKIIENLCKIKQNEDVIIPIKRAETHHKNHSSYPTWFNEFKNILNDILWDEIYEEELKKDIYNELNKHINPEYQNTYEYACNLGIDKNGNTRLVIYYLQNDTIDHIIVNIADTLEGTHHILDHIWAYYNNIKNALDYSDIDK